MEQLDVHLNPRFVQENVSQGMRLIRLAAVFAGLALAGTLVGAVSGVTVAAILVGLTGGPAALRELGEGYAIAAMIGAACGALLAPVASLAFMRRVPLWRLYLETAIGTTAAGAFAFSLHASMLIGLVVAVAGFLVAGGRLAWVYRDPVRVRESPPAT